jgi:hypothetical protein
LGKGNNTRRYITAVDSLEASGCRVPLSCGRQGIEDLDALGKSPLGQGSKQFFTDALSSPIGRDSERSRQCVAAHDLKTNRTNQAPTFAREQILLRSGLNIVYRQPGGRDERTQLSDIVRQGLAEHNLCLCHFTPM